ncbi:methyltransferase [Chromobacterium sp. TRC.1.1.SA]|uniref:Methyltransferase n=1 Tax=Chromobacterium indicum TaxID=3110228 RepID=A0ABV0CMP6_9NEIS
MFSSPPPVSTAVNSHRQSSLLHDLMYGHIYASALRAVVFHHIPDALAAGPRGVEELAAQTGVMAEPLERVLRLLAMKDLFHKEDDGMWDLSPAGRSLCSDAVNSQREAALLFTDEMFRHSAAGLPNTLMTGLPGFEVFHGMEFFPYLRGHSEKNQVFDKAMVSITAGVNEKIARSYLFPETGTVVDVAGGRGGLLKEVLALHPGLSGVLLDRPETIASHLLDGEALKGRCRIVAGDIFSNLTVQGDIYLLKNVLHDFSDGDAVKILRNVRSAMRPGAKLLVIEAVLPDDGSAHPAVALDIVMLMTVRGRERTESEFDALLGSAGFRMSSVLPTLALSSIIEAEAV